ncbi:hypothetical protein [Emticicia agri]|uniref:Uncharacterized protein n=1 Tax=Emticicia agri TaxID=2492393 RepID=A0A4Q5LUX0_9BACT|nr:hypothetical protein [Emticicia agri]RYU93478.1 hypothetical protein EWM59_21895 [Emticicia agri]
MKTQLIIKTSSFKSFLQLFDRNEIVKDFVFGDTGYKSEGYVDEKIFNGLHRVEDILNSDYDSDGPTIFSAVIDKMEVELLNDYPVQQYKVCGEDFRLRGLINKVIELNTYAPDTYSYSAIEPLYF